MTSINTLGDEADEGFIHGGVHNATLKGVLTEDGDIVPHNMLVFLEEDGMNYIYVGALIGLKEFMELIILDSLRGASSKLASDLLRLGLWMLFCG